MDGLVIDLALVLVVLAVLTGGIWGAYVWRQRRSGADPSASEPIVVEYARTFFPVIVIVLVIRSFAFEPFRIPSSSMLPTLETGDFIFVNKYVFGLRLPVLNTKVVEIGEPERGDVVVFRLPSDNKTNYIKRVIGLPGDRIDYNYGSKALSINGEAVPVEFVGSFLSDLGRRNRAVETLGEMEHEILIGPALRSCSPKPSDCTPLPAVVPPGHFFVMGDNRDNSSDSRFRRVGFIPEENLVGRAVAIWFHWKGFGHWPEKWGRIGNRIN